MTTSNNASHEYLKNTVNTASPEQLQLMLFDGAIRFTTRGAEAMRAKDIAGTFTALDRAQRITLQLMDGLNRDANPALVDQMRGLLDFIYRRLIDGNLYKDEAALEDALRILKHQRETWLVLMQKVAQNGAGTAVPGGAAVRPGAVSAGAARLPAGHAATLEGAGLSLEG